MEHLKCMKKNPALTEINYQRMNLKNIYKSLSAVALMLFFGSCDRDRNTTGWQYFDDMAQSPAYETYSPNPNFADGKTMRNPVEGTIPVGYQPYLYEKNDTDRVEAGLALINPYESNAKNLERGKLVYNVYCTSCHGDQGDGKGFLFTSKKYPYPPANLLTDKIRNNPEGEIYHVITVGFGVMPQHGSQVRPEDRWKVAMYIKEVLHKQ
ncbi:MAG TPA: cytochrome C [Prolixibacteraceae bacterium]|nr:cytochrome C [Prolixibacteraceae bacterium]